MQMIDCLGNNISGSNFVVVVISILYYDKIELGEKSLA